MDIAAETVEPAVVPRRGAKLFFVGATIAQVAALLRYITLARFLGPEQLGLAATLVVTGAFFDMISDAGSDRFLIQDPDGNAPEAQSLVQLVYIGRGVSIALALAIFSVPISLFYGQPRLAPGLALLALSPLVTGFFHFDIRRAQRWQDFRGEGYNRIVGETASLVATALAAALTHSFTAILFGLVGRSIVTVVFSHLFAKRPYRLGYSRTFVPRLREFGIPLMLSGLLLFVGSQGDRVLVAHTMGARILGLYSATLLLVYYPSALLLNYIHVIFLPLVAARRGDGVAQGRVVDDIGGLTLLLAVAMMLGFAVVGPVMIPILYGSRYREPVLLVGLIGVLSASRFLMVWPTTIALGLGKSRTVLASNFVRLLAYPGAYVGYRLSGGLVGIVEGFSVGELVAVCISMVLVNRNAGMPRLSGFDRLAVFTVMLGVVVLGDIAWDRRSLLLAVVAALGLIGALFRMVTREKRTFASVLTLATGVFTRAKAVS